MPKSILSADSHITEPPDTYIDLLEAEADLRRQRTQSDLARLDILRAWFNLALASGVEDF